MAPVNAIKGGFSLDLGQAKLDSNGQVDLAKSVSVREVDQLMTRLKDELGAEAFNRRRGEFEFRLASRGAMPSSN